MRLWIEAGWYLAAGDIAETLGVSMHRIATWLHRGQMPAPDVRISRDRPLWRAERIEPWIAAMRGGRIAEMDTRYRRTR